MSSLEVDLNSSVIGTNGKSITGLSMRARLREAPRVTTALAGTSLLGCVVFGRVTGKHAAKAKLGANAKASRRTRLSVVNFAKLGVIANEVGTLLMANCAHYGLVTTSGQRVNSTTCVDAGTG